MTMVLSFGPNHPFWKTAIELRQKHSTIAEIVRAAESEGHVLTYKQINNGLKRAPVNLYLPPVASQWLRDKYEALEKNFNAFTTMRDLTMEAIARAGEAEEELIGDEEITPARRTLIEMNRDRWLSKAFEWAKECAKIEVQVGGLLLDKQPEKPKEDIDGQFRELIEEFKKELPKTDLASLSQSHGGNNVRLPGEENDK